MGPVYESPSEITPENAVLVLSVTERLFWPRKMCEPLTPVRLLMLSVVAPPTVGEVDDCALERSSVEPL